MECIILTLLPMLTQRVGCSLGGVSPLTRLSVGDGGGDSEERGAVLSGTRQVQEKKR